MASFLLSDLSIDFESNLSLISQPYPETSTSLFIKDLPPRQVYDWKCQFVLLSYSEATNCRLRIQTPPNESCPEDYFSLDEDIVFYSEKFGVKLLDLFSPDILQTYAFSQVKFHQYFVNMPYHTSKMCLTVLSPEKMVMIIRSRKNLEISCTKGVILDNQDKLFAAGKNN